MAKRTVEEEQDDNKKKDKNDKLADQRLQQIKKALGITDESVRLADQHISIKNVISTGLPELDKILTPMIYEKTGKGGFPRGFVGEFFGPYSGGKSSLCMKLAGDVTKRGGFVLWIDAEGSYVSEWAAQHGVNNKNVVLIDNLGHTGEYFLEQVETIAASGTVELIVVDSVTALVPKEVLECELEKEARIGAGAKLMTRALPRIIAAAKKGDTAVIFVNQIRQKIGVMYGCFHKETPITFADGRKVRIKEVVEKKLTGPILSYDTVNGKVIETNITNWFNNGKLRDEERWISIKTSSSGSFNGANFLTCTDGHNILMSTGYVKASELKVGDKLLSHFESRIENNKSTKEFVYGSLLGDGAIHIRAKNTGYISLQNYEQPEYLKWKMEKLNGLGWKKVAYGEKLERYNSYLSTEIVNIRKKFYNKEFFEAGEKSYRSIPEGLKLTPLMVAVLYMDNGHGTFYREKNVNEGHYRCSISFRRLRNLKECYKEDYRKRIISMFAEFINCDPRCLYIDKNFILHIRAAAVDNFLSRICSCVPPPMQYKLAEKYRGQYKDFSLSFTPERKVCGVTITKIVENSLRKNRELEKFDIEVADTNNYMVGGCSNGIIVHNSNETTPYGEALKFYSSLRLRLSQVGRSERNITKGEEDIGIRTNVRIEKSRFGPPFKECIMPIYYGNVLPQPLDSLLDAALASKVLKSRSKSMPNGERVQTFTFGSIKKDGMDEFKKTLDNTIIKKMAELIKTETKTLLEAHVQEYINKLGSDELTSDVPATTETDPGA
jgi:recombination protein RecA